MKTLKRKILDFADWFNNIPLRWEKDIRPVELQKSKEIALELCNKMKDWGINAAVAPDEGQYAVIEITGSYIRWVRITYNIAFISDDPGYCVVKLVIPDSQPLPRINIVAKPALRWRAILAKFGQLISVHWNGNDMGVGLIKNIGLESVILKAGGFTSIKFDTRPYHGYDCWEITPVNRTLPQESTIKKQEQWRSCENIAAALLAISITK